MSLKYSNLNRHRVEKAIYTTVYDSKGEEVDIDYHHSFEGEGPKNGYLNIRLDGGDYELASSGWRFSNFRHATPADREQSLYENLSITDKKIIQAIEEVVVNLL